MEIFETSNIGAITLKNRIIRSATHEGMADTEGRPTEQLVKFYTRLAKGEIGAIVCGYAGVQPNGKSSLHNMLMMHRDDFIKDYRPVVEAVHQYDTPFLMQVAHAGRQTRGSIIGHHPVAPSAIRDWHYYERKPRALTEPEIEEIIENFVKAIVRGRDAGFDGAQVHAAHGYLLSEFLSPRMNKRTDKWGGSLENRFRIIHEIFTRARKAVGSNYPLWVKMNGHDQSKNGLRVEESVQIAKYLENVGCEAIEISGGTFEEGASIVRGADLPIEAMLHYSFMLKNRPEFVKKFVKRFASFFVRSYGPIFNFNAAAAESIKKNVKVPVIAVGGLHILEDIENVLKEGSADYVAMCRPFIIEPQIVKKFRLKQRERSRCINCNYCGVLQEELPLKCHIGLLPKDKRVAIEVE